MTKVSKKKIKHRKQDRKALRPSERKLRSLSSAFLQAQERERKRIASELHDGIGASLSAIKFSVENGLSTLEGGVSDAVADLMRGVVVRIQDVMGEVRRISMNLRPSTLDNLGILATIDWLCREFRSNCPGTRIIKHIGVEEKDIPDMLKIVIYRVVQEALNNVIKHAGATGVYVHLVTTVDQITLRISDNGRGLDLRKSLRDKNGYPGMGLRSMRERTELSEGRFSIESKPDKGTAITASWPRGELETD